MIQTQKDYTQCAISGYYANIPPSNRLNPTIRNWEHSGTANKDVMCAITRHHSEFNPVHSGANRPHLGCHRTRQINPDCGSDGLLTLYSSVTLVKRSIDA